jgi:hypothetical protein
MTRFRSALILDSLRSSPRQRLPPNSDVKLVLDLLHSYEPWPVSGIVFDEKIEIAVRPQLASHGGTEEREPSNTMPAAETLKSLVVEDG